MDDDFLQLCVIYRDPPDLVELEVRVQYRGWTARSTVYAQPHVFASNCKRLLEWATTPSDTLTLEAGADTGIGWLKLDFYTIGRTGHVGCSLQLATGKQPHDARPAETWRLAIEIQTELGLVERFARAGHLLSTNLDGEAKLIGLPS